MESSPTHNISQTDRAGASRLYVVTMACGSWRKRFFLEGPDSLIARNRLAEIIRDIECDGKSSGVGWLRLLDSARQAFLAAGFHIVAH